MDPHLPEHLDVVELAQPVAVAGKDGPVLFVEIQEPLHLAAETLRVVIDLFRGQHLAHVRLAGGVPHQGGPSAQQDNGPVPGFLQAGHGDQLQEVTHMQAIRRGVKADVEGDLLVFELFFDLLLIGHLGDEPTALEFLKNGHGVLFLLSSTVIPLAGQRIQKALCLQMQAEGESSRVTTSVHRPLTEGGLNGYQHTLPL